MCERSYIDFLWRVEHVLTRGLDGIGSVASLEHELARAATRRRLRLKRLSASSRYAAVVAENDELAVDMDCCWFVPVPIATHAVAVAAAAAAAPAVVVAASRCDRLLLLADGERRVDTRAV